MTQEQSTHTSTASLRPAVLVLESGDRFEGFSYGAEGRTLGELAFVTGMTGYQEALTDPAHAHRILVMTVPHIGNTGANAKDRESGQIWAAGLVVREASRSVSNFRAERSLDKELQTEEVVGITGIDTRALTRRIRSSGVLRAGIFAGSAAATEAQEQLRQVLEQPEPEWDALVTKVSTSTVYRAPAVHEDDRVGKLAVLDLGARRSFIEFLTEQGFDLTVFPATSSAEELLGEGVDGVLLPDGPRGAATQRLVSTVEHVLREHIPVFGVGAGHELLVRATGMNDLTEQGGTPALNEDEHVVASDVHGQIRALRRNGVLLALEGLDRPVTGVRDLAETAVNPIDGFQLFQRFREQVSKRTAATSAQGADQ